MGTDDLKAVAAREYLLEKHEEPFFLTVSFMNPHNVCELARDQKLPDGTIGAAPLDISLLPPLPENPILVINHNGPEKVYLNGALICNLTYASKGNRFIPIDNRADGAWKKNGKNIISIYANTHYFDGYLDVGLIDIGEYPASF